MTPQDALYRNALRSGAWSRWLRDEDLSRDYGDSCRFAAQQRQELLDVLTGDTRVLFRKYLDNMEFQTEMEQFMLFQEGLSIGLRFAAGIL